MKRTFHLQLIINGQLHAQEHIAHHSAELAAAVLKNRHRHAIQAPRVVWEVWLVHTSTLTPRIRTAPRRGALPGLKRHKGISGLV